MLAMNDSKESGSFSPLMLVVGGVVILGVIIAIATVGIGGSDEGSARESDTPRAEADEVSEPSSSDGRLTKGGEKRPPRKRKNYNHDLPLAVALANSAPWNPPRPLRFLVTHDGAGSEEAARRRAEDVRRRFVGGESAFALIREHSEAPRGIPRELISQYESLPPDQASPVLPIDSGFVVFFGTPTSPPDAGPAE